MKRDNGWAELLQQAAATREKKPPGKGWVTLKQIRDDLRLGRCRTYEFIAQEIEKGTIERFTGMECDDNGRLVRRTYYRLTGTK